MRRLVTAVAAIALIAGPAHAQGKGGVFTEEQIESYMELKWPEVARWEMTPSPVEFDMYYSA